MRTAWGSVVFIRVFQIFVAARLAQHFQQVRSGYGGGRVHRFLEYQQQPGSTRQVSLRGVPQSVVSTPVETSRQYMLQEPPQELDS